MASPELPRQLGEIEARWLSSQSAPIDYGPASPNWRSSELTWLRRSSRATWQPSSGSELKAVTAELEQLKAWSRTRVQMSHKAPSESVETRLARMLERLESGGEVAQGVVRELFPDGIWLYPDPNGGRFLWAHAQTAILHPVGLVDAEGRVLAEGFPRIYNVIAARSQNDLTVAGNGSGGLLLRVSRGPHSVACALGPRSLGTAKQKTVVGHTRRGMRLSARNCPGFAFRVACAFKCYGTRIAHGRHYQRLWSKSCKSASSFAFAGSSPGMLHVVNCRADK